MKNIKKILSENFHFLGGKTFNIFEQACFRNEDAHADLSLFVHVF